MVQTMFRSVVVLFPALLAVTLAGCESKSHRQGPSHPATEPAAALPAGLILKKQPDGAVDVIAAKQSARPGEPIVIRGRIGGRREPFVKDRAVFQLVDMSVLTCADHPGDSCETPWDYCCEPKDQITAKSATVQITGADGKPLALVLYGQEGLAPMAKVVVRGKVAAKPADAVLIVAADGIYIVQ